MKDLKNETSCTFCTVNKCIYMNTIPLLCACKKIMKLLNDTVAQAMQIIMS